MGDKFEKIKGSTITSRSTITTGEMPDPWYKRPFGVVVLGNCSCCNQLPCKQASLIEQSESFDREFARLC